MKGWNEMSSLESPMRLPFLLFPPWFQREGGQAFRRQWNAGGAHRSVQYIEVCGAEHSQQEEQRGHRAGPAVIGSGSIRLWMRPLIPTIRGALSMAEAWPALHLGGGCRSLLLAQPALGGPEARGRILLLSTMPVGKALGSRLVA